MGETNQNFTVYQMAQAVYLSTGISVSSYSLDTGKLTVLASSDMEYEYIFSSSPALHKVLLGGRKDICSQLVFNEINCGWAIVCPKNDEEMERDEMLLIGPIFLGALLEETVREYYGRKGLSVEEARNLAKACRKIPVIAFDVFWQQYMFLCALVSGHLPGSRKNAQEKEGEAVAEGAGEAIDEDKTESIRIPFNEEEYYYSQQRNFMISRRSENHLLDCVKRGDVESVQFTDQSALNELSSLAQTPIRSLKNNFITAITLIVRAAMESGVPVEIAFPLSDMYIQEIEDGENMAEIVRIYRQSLTDLTQRVRSVKYRQGLSVLVQNSCAYIEMNVEKPLNLAIVAQAQEVHPDYLSRVFKKEMGKSVNAFIREKKVEEATFRIRNTDKKLSEIAFELGYTSQGKFIEDFKKQTGVLPSQFRSH